MSAAVQPPPTKPSKPAGVEELAPGLSREYLHDNKLMILNFYTGFSRNVLDHFQKAYIDYSNERNNRVWVVYDYHNSQIALTPYLGQKVDEINKMLPGQTGRLAMAIPNPIIRPILQMFVRLRKHTQPRLDFGFFATRDQAIAWVEEGMRKSGVIQ